MQRLAPSLVFRSFRLWAFVAFLAAVFLLGGGARGDILSLLILRPVAVLACGLAALSLRWEHVRQNRFLFALAAASFLLVGLHLIPLPPWLWHSLPGRGFVAEIDANAGLGDVWRPISIAPLATWNALFSLFVPLAALLLGVQLSEQERHKLLPAIIVLGLVSGILGLLQVVGSPEGPLYLYRITNNGSAVGLFANRNHQAVMLACLIPMLAVYASRRANESGESGIRGYVAIAAGVVLVPLLLVTGSRAGLILGVAGLVSTPLLYRRARREGPFQPPSRSTIITLLAVSIGMAGLVVVTIILGRAEAFNRIMAPDPLADVRFSVWRPIADLAWRYFPFGSGIGSFVEAYQIDEPHELLGPNYLNHAHNDWLEVYMTGGAAGLLLLAAVGIGWFWLSLKLWLRPAAGYGRRFGRLGSVLLLMLAFASFGDYPLRVPSFAALAVVFALWMRDGDAAARGNAQ